MIGAVVILSIIAVLAVIVALGLLFIIEFQGKQIAVLVENNHERCVEGLLEATANHVKAEALRQAAEVWDSVEEQGNLKRLGWTKYHPGGPSMPVIWMHDRADKIEGAQRDDI